MLTRAEKHPANRENRSIDKNNLLQSPIASVQPRNFFFSNGMRVAPNDQDPPARFVMGHQAESKIATPQQQFKREANAIFSSAVNS